MQLTLSTRQIRVRHVKHLRYFLSTWWRRCSCNYVNMAETTDYFLYLNVSLVNVVRDTILNIASAPLQSSSSSSSSSSRQLTWPQTTVTSQKRKLFVFVSDNILPICLNSTMFPSTSSIFRAGRWTALLLKAVPSVRPSHSWATPRNPFAPHDRASSFLRPNFFILSLWVHPECVKRRYHPVESAARFDQ